MTMSHRSIFRMMSHHYKGDIEKILSFCNKTSTNMDDIQKSKMDAFIPQIREHAYYTEKTRRDYLRECSEYFGKYLNDFLMKEKCFWMRNCLLYTSDAADE